MNKNITDTDIGLIIETLSSDLSMRSLACLLLVYTGARANEVLRLNESCLTIEMIDGVETPKVHIYASKRGENRWIPLPPELLARIKDLRGKLQESGGILASLLVQSFSNGQGLIDASYNSCGLYFKSVQVRLFNKVKYTLHAFRHSLAVRAIKSGFDIIEVQAMLGHANINSTYQYLKEYRRSIVLNKVPLLLKGVRS